MSDVDQVAVVKGSYEAFNRRDIDAAVAVTHPDVVWIDSPDYPGSDTYEGREAVAAHIASPWEAMETWEVRPLDFMQSGRHVIVPCRSGGRGRGSGAEVTHEVVQVWSFRGSKVERIRGFNSLDDAVRAIDAGVATERATAS